MRKIQKRRPQGTALFCFGSGGVICSVPTVTRRTQAHGLPPLSALHKDAAAVFRAPGLNHAIEFPFLLRTEMPRIRDSIWCGGLARRAGEPKSA